MTETLDRIGQTSLYAPATGETYVFLLWDAPPEPDPSIPLAATWADVGMAACVGYFAFLRAVPSGTDATKLEAELRGVLPQPATTGFAWAEVSPEGELRPLGVVDVALDASDRPIVAKESPITVPKGIPAFRFAAALSVRAAADDSGMMGLRVTAESGATPGPGIYVPLAGDHAGCIRFQAFLESTVHDDRTVKPLADASLDPIRPFDPVRTHVRPVGTSYVLSVDAEGKYHLTPATEDVA